MTVPASSQTPIPIDSNFQVNTYTTNLQIDASISIDGAGNFVVVWQSGGSDGTDVSGYSIQGRRFTADSTAKGDDFQVNTFTTDSQRSPAVAADTDGNFVVVWASDGSTGTDTGSRSIQGQRFTADGIPQGAQFQVNTYTTGNQNQPEVAVDLGGDFVVVWPSVGSSGTDTDSNSIQGQRFAANGTPLGGQFQVNSYTTGNQPDTSIALDDDGNFVVVWTSFGSGGSDSDASSMQGQRFAADGTPLGAQFQINNYTTGSQGAPAVGFDAEGRFVVVWQSDGSSGTDSSSRSVQGQRYTAAGTPMGSEFQVNSYTISAQGGPAVAVRANGDFVVVWDSYGSGGEDTDGFSVQARAFSASGAPSGGDFQVNDYTTSYQVVPSVSTDADGDFVVVWESYGSNDTDTSGLSIQAQRYRAVTIFADGFESGDTSAWSDTL